MSGAYPDTMSAQRTPLASVQPNQATTRKSAMAQMVKSAKRTHSPEPTTRTTKRQRTDAAIASVTSRGDRERQKEEFRIEYTRRFPEWTFLFDDTNRSAQDAATPRILSLHGTIASAFTKDVTHLITNRQTANKENNTVLTSTSLLQSPIKLNSAVSQADNLLARATHNGIKIWTYDKLASVLERLLDPPEVASAAAKKRLQQRKNPTPKPSPAPNSRAAALAVFDLKKPPTRPTPAPANPSRQLGLLLKAERLRGTTEERDHMARRADYNYFGKGVCFSMCEDLRGEELTLWAYEYDKYPITLASRTSESGKKVKEKAQEKDKGPPWPMLYADPRAYNPFAPFDERSEQRRAQREAETAEYDRMVQRQKNVHKREKARRLQLEEDGHTDTMSEDAQEDSVPTPPLRRRAESMSNLATAPLDLSTNWDAEKMGASGVNASAGSAAYWAASGNSMPLSAATTMPTTTSVAGLSGLGMGANGAVLPKSLLSTLRFPPSFPTPSTGRTTETEKENQPTVRRDHDQTKMPPPSTTGSGAAAANALRRTKSTGGLRVKVHKKETPAARAGYCENCRIRFEDINEHVRTRKHIRFATDPVNFSSLDVELARLVRPALKPSQGSL